MRREPSKNVYGAGSSRKGMEISVKISMVAYFSHGYLCRRRHKVAFIAESNLKFDSRFLRRKESSAEWRLVWQV